MADDKFIAKLTQSLENIVTLKVTTYVGTVLPDASATPTDASAKIMRTQIDMITGDIKTEMDPAFVTGDYASLRDFHAGRELQGAEIIRKNVDTLKQLFHLLRDARQNPPLPPSNG